MTARAKLAEPIQKWEFWSNGRRRSRTICITLHAGGTELTIAHRAVGTDGRMSQLHAFTCDLECLPKLLQSLTRVLAAASKRGFIKAKRQPLLDALDEAER